LQKFLLLFLKSFNYCSGKQIKGKKEMEKEGKFPKIVVEFIWLSDYTNLLLSSQFSCSALVAKLATCLNKMVTT